MPEETTDRLKGFVYFFDKGKKYGRIHRRPTGGGKIHEYHFHWNSLIDKAQTIATGLLVEFTPVLLTDELKGNKMRDRAVEIRVVG